MSIQAYEHHVIKQIRLLSAENGQSVGEIIGLFSCVCKQGSQFLLDLERQKRANPWYANSRRAFFLLKPITKPCVAFISVNASLLFNSDDVCLHDVFAEAELEKFDLALKMRFASAVS